MSDTICGRPDVSGRVPIAKSVPKLTRSPQSSNRAVNMVMCLADFFGMLKAMKCLAKRSMKRKEEKKTRQRLQLSSRNNALRM